VTRRAVVLATMVALAAAAAVTVAPVEASTKRKFSLTSTAFANSGTIPTQYTCTGAGMSPPLAWKHVPARAKDLALIVEDPDTPIGIFVHWVVAGIKPKPPSIAGDSEPAGAVQGNNGTGRPGWRAPCPPPGPAHHYIFTLYALKKKVTLPPGSDAATLRAAMQGKIIGQTKLVGRYGTT
jgi:Raf kinase inhibitor-like YbhB/YbcL family protein